MYLRGKPRIFRKASISVFHKAASHDPTAGCQTRPHNSSKRSEEAGADGSVWWGGKISGCQWEKKKKRQKRVWKMPFSEFKRGTNYHEIIKQVNTHGAISCMFVALVSSIFLSLHVKFLFLSIETNEKLRRKMKSASLLLTLMQLSLKPHSLMETSTQWKDVSLIACVCWFYILAWLFCVATQL